MKKLLLIALTVLLAMPALAGVRVGTWGLNWPTIGMDMGAYSVDLGLLQTEATPDLTAYMLKADYKLSKIGEAQSTVGLAYTSNGATTATTTLNVLLGAAVAVGNASIGADIILYQQTQVGAATATTLMLPMAVMKATLAL